MGLKSSGDRRLRVVVVGTGMIGRIHARSVVAAGAELVGIVGSTPERGEQHGRELKVPAFARLDDVVADDSIDAVHICTPNSLHVAQTLAVIESGKHVVCEKPLAVTAVDATKLASAAAEAGVVGDLR